jgi:hypothetical protein
MKYFFKIFEVGLYNNKYMLNPSFILEILNKSNYKNAKIVKVTKFLLRNSVFWFLS